MVRRIGQNTPENAPSALKCQRCSMINVTRGAGGTGASGGPAADDPAHRSDLRGAQQHAAQAAAARTAAEHLHPLSRSSA
jgi:hypothetical protein